MFSKYFFFPLQPPSQMQGRTDTCAPTNIYTRNSVRQAFYCPYITAGRVRMMEDAAAAVRMQLFPIGYVHLLFSLCPLC